MSSNRVAFEVTGIPLLLKLHGETKKNPPYVARRDPLLTGIYCTPKTAYTSILSLYSFEVMKVKRLIIQNSIVGPPRPPMAAITSQWVPFRTPGASLRPTHDLPHDELCKITDVWRCTQPTQLAYAGIQAVPARRKPAPP